MPPRNRFETEYNANFKPHEIRLALKRQHLKKQDGDVLCQEAPSKGENGAGDDSKKTNQKIKVNRALQYKAGLAPSMPAQNKIRYLSEYQKQFEWKRPLEREAPILSAEMMIYGGQDRNPSKASTVKLPKKTEYQLQFIRHPIVSASPESKGEEMDKDKAREKGHQAVYSPLGYQDTHAAAGRPSRKSPPPIIPRKSMVFQSEYHANFKSPSKYVYAKGSWVGADPPHLHTPDEKSDSEIKPSSIAWYQQVLELREKVHSYRCRAREGSHFFSLLKDLQKQDDQETPAKDKEEPHERAQHVHLDTPQSEPSRKSTPVKTKAQRDENVTKSDAKPKEPNRGHPENLKDGAPAQAPRVDPVNAEEPGQPRLFWDKNIALPGPPLKKVNSLENISNKRANGSSGSSHGELTPVRRGSRHEEPTPVRREAWFKERPDRALVIPPYHISTSSASTASYDSRSDVTISDIDHSNTDHQEPSFDDKPPRREIPLATRQFTGKRQELGDDRRVDTHCRGDSLSSSRNDGSTTSNSFMSQNSDAFSVEAMDKRRALASLTLQRAKRRQAQL